MAFRRRKKIRMDDTRTLIREAEANRKRLISLAAELGVYVDDLRALTISLRKKQEGTGPPDGGAQAPS